MNETQPLPTDATLQQRCAEIVEWQRTGVFPGTALRDYAAALWAEHYDALQMAERDTSARAMELIAKWGTPAPVGVEPVAWTLTAELDKRETTTRAHLWFSDPVNCMWTPLYTAAQALAMGRVPLTDEWIRSRCKEPWIFETAKQWVRMAEEAHGIKQGGQHGDN